MSYKKEFQEVLFDDVIIDFSIATGKVYPNAQNIFYFVAFKGEDKIFKTQIENATLFKKARNRFNVVQTNIKSNEEGMGKFQIPLSKKDVEDGVSFYLKVNFNQFIQKDYLVFDT